MKISGATVVEVVVSPERRVAQFWFRKTLGYGLDVQTWQTVKKWRFRPAKNASGTPVDVLVPIEVSYRLN